ncbi:MAG: GHKL domain-containing protein [Spirochaetales bacterium]|jgi:two-component system, sporulation sensor kinase E|nr:GHKL domain-containing protein [Spirochaetales bacterium]HPB42179.1 ATP-binding protein [Sphaerochaeta sp.]HPY45136.1 ATP-binding protein [Sphaerochaeta sp.]HQB05722.1 ATP-binding protein [Sphaerochaeta sp.]
MKNFVRRAIEKIDQLDSKQIVEILESQSREMEMLEATLESIEDGFILADKHLRILYANSVTPTLVPMIRLKSYEGVALDEVLHDPDVLSFITANVEGREIEIKEDEFTFQKGDQLQTVKVTVYPYKDGSSARETSFVIRLTDVTEYNRAEARLRRSESLASMTTMAAGVAHEIKNPLAAMGIHLQLLKKAYERNESLTFEDARRYIDVLDEEIARLNAIVVDFLFAVRPIDVRIRLERITTLLDQVCDFVEPELNGEGIVLKRTYPATLPGLMIDNNAIKQALLNIIKNAMNAIKDSGTIEVGAKIDSNNVVVSIKDTGVGIPEEALGKIFEPYYTTKSGGTGLGLTVVYKIMKEHRGDIQVHSVVGTGTTVRLIFPIPSGEHLALEEVHSGR